MPVIVFIFISFIQMNVLYAAGITDPANSPYCTLTSQEVCVDSADRVISGVTVTRPCWRYEKVYSCFGAVNECQPYIDRGCAQTQSNCLINDPAIGCVLYGNTFECQRYATTSTTTQVCGAPQVCLGQSCFTPAQTSNTDFGQVAAQFASVAAAGASAGNSGGVTIFEGTPEYCNRIIGNIVNCCNGSGVLTPLFKKQCSASAVALAGAKDARTAHFVGSVCAVQGPIGGCLRTTENWCTFPSLLARIIQEQGRPQLGISWGTASTPDCRGFTSAELQQLNFSTMDLSELQADILNNLSLPNGASMGSAVSTKINNYFQNNTSPSGGALP